MNPGYNQFYTQLPSRFERREVKWHSPGMTGFSNPSAPPSVAYPSSSYPSLAYPPQPFGLAETRPGDMYVNGSNQLPAPVADQPEQTISLLIPSRHMGLVIGKSRAHKKMLEEKHGLTLAVNNNSGVEDMSEFIMRGTASSLEAAKLDIIQAFALKKIPHEEFSQKWPVADNTQSQPNPPSQRDGQGTGVNEEEEDDDIMVYLSPEDATPVHLNQLQQKQPLPARPSSRGRARRSPSRSPDRQSDAKHSRSADRQAGESEDLAVLQKTCRIQEETIRSMKMRMELYDVRNERMSRQMQSTMSNTEEIVFLKLELEEKSKVAESYRVDNYKLLQQLETLVKRVESLETENESLHKQLRHRANPGDRR